MKNFYFSTFLLLLSMTFFSFEAEAQAPQTMTYQSVLRNSSNALVANTAVGIKISVLQGSSSGNEAYVETQMATTNANGLVSLQIGAGTADIGTFSEIDWANGPYFIKTEIDPTGGSNYSITGTQQMASVPYALYAAKSGGTVFEPTMDFPDAIHNTNAGNVGIGTDLPSSKLDIAGDIRIRGGNPAQGKVLTSDDTGAATWQTPAVQLTVFEPTIDMPDAIHNTNAGNVGIGTDLPSEKLDVSGNVRVRGNVGIGTQVPNASAALEINSTTGALLLPRMTTEERNNLNASEGMIIYNSTDLKYQGFSSTIVNADPVVDQSQLAIDNALGIPDMSQSFTAGLSGALTSVRVLLNCMMGPQTATIYIRDGAGNSGAIRYQSTATINYSDGGNWVTINPSSVNLIAGTVYSINIVTQGGFGPDSQIDWFIGADNYSGGNLFWGEGAYGADGVFETTVTPAPTGSLGWININAAQAGASNEALAATNNQVQTNTTDIVGLQNQLATVQSNFVITQDDPSSIYNVNQGNVGIGTDLPSEKLDVNGNLKVRQNATVSGTATASSFVKDGGTSSQYLMADGSTSTGTVATTMGAIGGSSTANGGTITAGVLKLTPADATNGGLVTTGAQTFAGNKTFSSPIKITAGSPGAGKVLTSDGNGVAFWANSGGVATAGPGISLTGTGTSIDPYIVSTKIYTIGLWPELGGYVFRISADGRHGLVAETQDDSIYVLNWWITKNGINDTPSHSLNGKNFMDWRLPTVKELLDMYTKRVAIGGFGSSLFWSSADSDPTIAFMVDFSSGNYSSIAKVNLCNARAVRAF